MLTQAHPWNQSQALFLDPDSFFFPSSYLRDSWNGPVHGKRSQIPAADFSGRRHLLLCQRMRPCEIVSRWPHGSVSRRRNRTGPSERTVFMAEGTRATQRLLLRTSISSLKAMGTESNFKFYKTKRIQQILYFFFFFTSLWIRFIPSRKPASPSS